MPPVTRRKKAVTAANPPPPPIQPDQPIVQSSAAPKARTARNRKGKQPRVPLDERSPTAFTEHNGGLQEGVLHDQQQTVMAHKEAENLGRYSRGETTSSILHQSMLDGLEEVEEHEQSMIAQAHSAKGQEAERLAECQNRIGKAQFRQYDTYLEDLRQRGLIHLEQKEEMMKAARARVISTDGEKGTKDHNPIRPSHSKHPPMVILPPNSPQKYHSTNHGEPVSAVSVKYSAQDAVYMHSEIKENNFELKGHDPAQNPAGILRLQDQPQNASSTSNIMSGQLRLKREQQTIVTEKNQNVNVDLIQQKAKDQEESMRNWSQREREIAAYKETKRKAKELAKLERHTRMERDIVSSAINAVIAEMSNGAPSSSLEESLDPTSTPDRTNINTAAPRLNAFSMMMNTPSTARPKQRRAPPMDFSHYIPNFEKALEQTGCGQMSERDWAKFVGKKIASCVQSDIIAHTHEHAHLQTRINAMNALLEVVTGVAYTPGAVADFIRASHTPGYLIACLFITSEKFSESEAKRMLKDKWFVETLIQLRREPVLEWKGDTWNGLDDVLRVLNYPGPVDFRRVFKKVKEKLDQQSESASSSIIKSIRREVSDYVTHDSCFETKYNALNVLADIGVGFLQGTLQYPRKDEKLVVETLCGALLKIGESLTVHEIEQIVEEFRMDESIPSANISTDFDQLLIPDTTRSVYIQEYDACRQERENINILLQQRFHVKTPEYCQSSLLMKLYLLRWKSLKLNELWESSKAKLEGVLSILVGTSAPIGDGEYLLKLSKNFSHELSGQIHDDGYGTLRESVDRSIYQISKRASSKASYDSRINAFKILTTIGLQLVGWLDPKQPFWKTRIFKDQITEDTLTDAMRSICHSLVQDDRTKLLAQEGLMEGLANLNSQRLQLEDAMLGLDATMDLINGVEDLSSSAATVAARNKRKVAEILDLTDGSVSAKRQAVARTPGKVVAMIDLTDD